MIAAAGYYRLRSSAGTARINLSLGPVLEWNGDGTAGLSANGPKATA
jgi:hypothetical protein